MVTILRFDDRYEPRWAADVLDVACGATCDVFFKATKIKAGVLGITTLF
jgi:hypothetical protein